MNASNHIPFRVARAWLRLAPVLTALLLAWLIAFSAASTFAADGPRPIDLKPFLGKSQYQSVGADWILPRGRHVVEGVPFQIDGAVEVAGTSARFTNVGRTNVASIPIGVPAERFYVIGAASRDVREGLAVARFELRFADGTRATLPVEYGRHVLDWMGARHKGESPLGEPDARVAWQAEHTAAARRDDSLRLYYFTLASPEPGKIVQSIDLVSGRQRGGFILAALTVGPERVDRQPDTLPRIEEHFHIEGTEKPTLTGRVTDEQGKSVANAMVRILSVRPVETGDQTTPEDNAFVGREARTDSSGRYQLEKLSERLLYQLMVVAPDTQPAMFDRADPLAGATNIRLLAGRGADTGAFLVHARVVGPDGKPVVGASIKPSGVGTGNSTSWGGNNGFPAEVLTGLNGEFIMARDQPFTRMSVEIRAPSLARIKPWLTPGKDVQTIKLGVGATLTGRVLKDDQPLAGVVVAAVGANRNSEVFAGNFDAKTDPDGRFRIENLPPNTEWVVYGQMASLRRDGVIPPQSVSGGDHGEVKDLGVLRVVPGPILAGRVKTSDGQPVPSGLRFNVNIESGWDSQTIRLDRQGRFEVTGLSTGIVEISLYSSADWSISSENHSIDEWNPWRLIGRLDQDKRDLEILIENKPRDYNSPGFTGQGYIQEGDRSRNRPLFGVEASAPQPLVLAGKVVDDKTGEPVTTARIIPGYRPRPTPTPAQGGGGIFQSILQAVSRPQPNPWEDRPAWEMARAQNTTNGGQFRIAIRRLSSVPLLRVEADGYDVIDTPTFSVSDSNIVLRLKKGSGPAGTLLGPDGQPAGGVAIIYAAKEEQCSLGTDATLSIYGDTRAKRTTAADGTFSFPSRAGGRRVFAANDTGWASVSITNWPADGKIRLQPWGKVTGVLTGADAKPLANIQVALEFQRNFQQFDPWVNFQDRPTTDAAGKFVFDKVPPEELRVVHLVPMQQGGWMHAFQTNFTIRAGQSLDLGPMTKTPDPNPGFR